MLKQLASARRRIKREAQARKLRARLAACAPGGARLHIGCGSRRFEGWLHVDLFPAGSPPLDAVLDLSLGLPLPEATVDLVYSEDFLEHVERDAGRRLLADCHRALRPGGTMRLLTPNLRKLVEQYIEQRPGPLAWYRERFGCRTHGDMLNAGMREWGHLYLYDEETLVGVVEELGFEVRRAACNESEEPALRGLDSRDSGQGSLSIYLDCRKK